MYEKLIITCDSTADLPKQLIDNYNIKVLPLNVHLGNDVYHDGVDVKPNDLFAFAANKNILPKTTEPTLQETHAFFSKYVFRGYTVIHFTISSSLSASYNVASTVASQIGRVHVIDTRTASTAEGMIVLHAAELLEQGKSAKEIIDDTNFLIGKVRATFVLDKMDFLYKGGRCSALAKFGAGIFNIKPNIIVNTDGMLSVEKKYRGKFDEVIEKFLDFELDDGMAIDNKRFFLVHTGTDKNILDLCEKKIKEVVNPQEFYKVTAGCTISSHLGPDVILLIFMKKFGLS